MGAEGARATDVLQRSEAVERAFQWTTNEDAMETKKLLEGIRDFAKDTVEPEDVVQARIVAARKRRRISHKE